MIFRGGQRLNDIKEGCSPYIRHGSHRPLHWSYRLIYVVYEWILWMCYCVLWRVTEYNFNSIWLHLTSPHNDQLDVGEFEQLTQATANSNPIYFVKKCLCSLLNLLLHVGILSLFEGNPGWISEGGLNRYNFRKGTANLKCYWKDSVQSIIAGNVKGWNA